MWKFRLLIIAGIIPLVFLASKVNAWTDPALPPVDADSRPESPVLADSLPVFADSLPVFADSRSESPVVADSLPVIADSLPVFADSLPVFADSRSESPVVADSLPVIADSLPVFADSLPVVADSPPKTPLFHEWLPEGIRKSLFKKPMSRKETRALARVVREECPNCSHYEVITALLKLPSESLRKLQIMCQFNRSTCKAVNKVISVFKTFPDTVFEKISNICIRDPTTCFIFSANVTPLGAIPTSMLSDVLCGCNWSPEICVDQITDLVSSQEKDLGLSHPNHPDVKTTFYSLAKVWTPSVEHLGLENYPKPTPANESSTRPNQKQDNASGCLNKANIIQSQSFMQTFLLLCTILIGRHDF